MKLNRLSWIAVLSALAGSLLISNSVGAAGAASPMDIARQLNQAFIEVADKVSPSVVVIFVAHKPDYQEDGETGNPLLDMLPKEFRKRFEDAHPRRKPSRKPIFDGQGSGVILRKDGYIMTNRHVVDGADKIKVKLKDGREFDAEVRGVDAQSDIAVIKITQKDATGLIEAKMGDSSAVRVGEFAIAIGAPFDLDYSVTIGHVSAKGRSRVLNDPAMDQDFIQTDASINPGNSGGPLVNIDGEVIGINTLIRGLHTGIGFAVPVNLAKEVAAQLISDGRFTRAWLGVAITSLKEDPEYRELVKTVTDGVIVREISPDGPAAKSDLKPGDVITLVDGRPVTTSQQLKNEIRSKKIGQAVTLDVVRKDKNIKVKVKPDEWPDESGQVAGKASSTKGTDANSLGLTVQSLTKETAEKFGVDLAEGVIVTEVQADSPAEAKGIKPGDVITEVNRQPVTTPKQFREAAKEADLKKGVIVNLKSRGTSKFVVLKDSGE